MTEPRDRIRVVHLDDDPDIVDVVSTFLEREDDRIEVETATSAADGLSVVAEEPVDCVVSDYEMPDMTGIDLLETLREDHPDLPFLLYTGKGSEEVASDAISAGVTDYLQKQGGTDQYAILANRVVNAVERYRAEGEADETRSQLRAISENSADAIVIMDADSRVRFANPAVETLFGYSPDELEGDRLTRIMPERLRERHLTAVERYLETGERAVDWSNLDFPGLRKDGTEIPLSVSFGAFEQDGEPRFLGIIRDITDRKERELEYERTISFLQELYEVATTLDLSVTEKITQLLEAGKTHLDLPPGYVTRIEVRPDEGGGGTQRVIEASGDHELLQPGESCPLSRSYCRKTIQRDEIMEIPDAKAAGWEGDPAYELFDLGSYIGSPVRIDDDLYGTVFFAGQNPRADSFTEAERTFVRLTSQLVSYELQRERTTEELEQRNERLAEFASIVSHDLRSPLNVAVGRLALAREECDSEHLESVARVHDRMEALIDDLLTLAREGEEAAAVEPVDLGACCEACWANVETGTASLTVEVDRKITADRSQVQQLLENLYRNAVEHGGETVAVTVGPLDGGFYVEDDGPGIPAADRDEVFTPGYTTGDRGTGFGLSIVQQVVETHGWELAVTSGASGGARFEITGIE